ncbi:DUF4336 domain-containing protein [uncultured Maritimibacter sp.]|jgi:hypothetical protein|uniref:DUF4336 domain-containing protein n=1 Tax=uncultured Maritimibacter sp. TaxID=991866 RepID=UPI000A864458|nr:DUF4336 domain-containing protein [uncultured Maritimibacter sp.]
MATGYEPLDRLKPVAHDIWIIDGPAIRFYGMPFSTRATVVRLASGALWVHSPTKMSEPLRSEVEALGPVAHLVAPNWIHYAYVQDWANLWPEARTWAAPGVAERAAKHGVPGDFEQTLRQEPPPDWAGEIDQMIVRGSDIHREAVFFHCASRTLILTDLIENFERENLPWWMRLVTPLVGVVDPDGRMPRDMRLTFRKGRDLLRADVERMIGWNPEAVILAHGRWYVQDGVKELRRAFRWVL